MFCPNCGTRTAEAVTFCRNCGEKMEPDTATATPAPAASVKKREFLRQYADEKTKTAAWIVLVTMLLSIAMLAVGGRKTLRHGRIVESANRIVMEEAEHAEELADPEDEVNDTGSILVFVLFSAALNIFLIALMGGIFVLSALFALLGGLGKNRSLSTIAAVCSLFLLLAEGGLWAFINIAALIVQSILCAVVEKSYHTFRKSTVR